MLAVFLYHVSVKKNWKVIKKQKAWKPSCVYVCLHSDFRLTFCTVNLCLSPLLLVTLCSRGGPDIGMLHHQMAPLELNWFPLWDFHFASVLHCWPSVPHPSSTFLSQTWNPRNHLLPVPRCSLILDLCRLWLSVEITAYSLLLTSSMWFHKQGRK